MSARGVGWVGALVGAAVGAFLFLASALVAGSNNEGSIIPLLLSCPLYTGLEVLMMRWWSEGQAVSLQFLILDKMVLSSGVAQWSLYGYVLALGRRAGRIGYVLGGLGAVHLLTVLLAWRAWKAYGL